jgi:cyclopropane-fatty-acyl-phospholipid synthase
MIMKTAIDLVERGLVPDPLLRAGVRAVLARNLKAMNDGDCEARRQRHEAFLDMMRSSPVAVATDEANRQHYELPAEFFRTVLGSELKYSACWWPEGVTDLDQAEARTLELTCRRAGIEDGMSVLDMGCGWGSMALWVARHYPNASVTAVSNSFSQRRFIEDRARRLGVTNLEVKTCDMNTFEPERRFDRAVSVEMFEHMRNWPTLFERVAGWLEPDGQFLMHVFCHREHAYPYERRSETDWMTEHFFTGGIMPSDDLPLRFADHLVVADQWRMNGVHYGHTLNAWLKKMDAAEAELRPLFADTYGADADRWWHRWRLFFLSCAEFFAFRGGNEWYVSHYLLRPRSAAAVRPKIVPMTGSRSREARR